MGKNCHTGVAKYTLLVKQGTEIVASDLKVPLSMVGGVVHSTVTCAQEENAPPPMLVTELGMVMEVREEQYSNAPPPMLVTELGRVMEVREEQSSNALSPMLVTELPRVTEVRE